jgi:hypothetical protein
VPQKGLTLPGNPHRASQPRTTRTETKTCFSKGRGLTRLRRCRISCRPLRRRASRRPRCGRRQRIQIDRFTVARQNVWQVLDQRPSRLARRMAVREMTVTRCAKPVKPPANACGPFLHSHKRRLSLIACGIWANRGRGRMRSGPTERMLYPIPLSGHVHTRSCQNPYRFSRRTSSRAPRYIQRLPAVQHRPHRRVAAERLQLDTSLLAKVEALGCAAGPLPGEADQ